MHTRPRVGTRHLRKTQNFRTRQRRARLASRDSRPKRLESAAPVSFAFLLRSRTGRYFHVAAFATVLLTPVAISFSIVAITTSAPR